MKRIWVAALATQILVLTVGIAIAETARLDRASVRQFVSDQNRYWNRRDFVHFYATFDPHGRIVTVHRGKDGKTVRAVRSLAEDRRAAETFFGSTHASIHETDRIERIIIGPHEARANVRVRETTVSRQRGRTKVLHAVTEEVLAWRDGRIVSLGLTEFDGS